MAKIYTKTGDDGTTGLVGGARASKSDPRIDCVGSLDETNAAIGLAAVAAPPAVKKLLEQVQNELFVIGSILAAPNATARVAASVPELADDAVARLEREIDAADQQLPPLRQFILPGGSGTAARMHLARAVCRNAERKLVAFAQSPGGVPEVVIRYVNRLSDWLFTHARLCNHLAGVADVPWQKPPA